MSHCKPLLTVAGLPLIERTIATAARAGLKRFYVITGHQASQLEAFLATLAQRRGLAITAIRARKWQEGNAASLLEARERLHEPFALLMADHVFDESVLAELIQSPLDDADVVLATDFGGSRSRLVKTDEATKVRTAGDRIIAVGKDLHEYDGYDTGVFLCAPVIFDAAQAAVATGDASLSSAVQRLASQGRVRAQPVGLHAWLDVDTPADRTAAQRLLFGQSSKAEDGWVSRHLNRPLSSRVLTPLLLRLAPGITPNQVSVLGLAFTAAASLCFLFGALLPAAVLVHFASVLDGCDGEIARLKRLESRFGGFFDAVLDRFGDSLILASMGYSAWMASAGRPLWWGGEQHAALGLAVLALVGNLMVSYTSAKAVSDLAYRYRGRLAATGRGRDLRLLLLALSGLGAALLHPSALLVGLLAVALLTVSIVLTRLVIASKIEAGPRLRVRGEVRAVAFDFDGTIADTMPFLTNLAVDLLTKWHRVSPSETRLRYRETSGVAFADQLEEMFPGDPANETIVAEFEARKRDAIFDQPLFPETLDTLRSLSDRGIMRFIVSSTPLDIVAEYATCHGFEHELDAVRGSAAGLKKDEQLRSIILEHNLAAESVMFVGDSVRDHELARVSGVRFVGVCRTVDDGFRERGIDYVRDLGDVVPRCAPFVCLE
jgi:CDP-L-myo-inositol myo-inositolphosphotransferase